MKARVLLDFLYAHGAEVTLIVGERIRVVAPIGFLTDDLKAEIRRNKDDLLRLLAPDSVPGGVFAGTLEPPALEGDRALIWELGEQLGWPRLAFKPAGSIAGLAEAWEIFARTCCEGDLALGLKAAQKVARAMRGAGNGLPGAWHGPISRDLAGDDPWRGGAGNRLCPRWRRPQGGIRRICPALQRRRRDLGRP